ncbi:DUF6777 domain-containing protein [Streptomyces sp. NPDC050759]|uniref:DUF6777 domain-containing protein n=1 Tax=Streptomyces sp. NPDC050759 TaxID=3365635 RepID=UPI0037AD2F2C
MVRTAAKALVTACALAAALLVAGCGGDGGDGDENNTEANGEVLLQPAAAQGPSPFTRSTVTSATSATAPSPLTRTPQRAPTAPRIVSGAMPGLYGGTARVAGCDVARQIDALAADRSRERAFAQVVGVPAAAVPDFLRGLAPVVLRADTLVTDHGYRAGRASGFPSVLQAGTAVLVDDRGVPRVRCACGNPLTPPVAMRGGAVVGGRSWPGYRPARVVVVAPSEQPVTDITIIDLADHAWIERLIGHDCRDDQVLPAPQPEPSAPATPLGPRPDETALPEPSPSAESDCATPTGTPGVENCPTAPATSPPTGPGVPAIPPDGTRTTVPVDPDNEIGPETVPDTPDLPDGGGLIPDDPSEPAGTDTVLAGPAHVLGV